jgi:hypothetical protein
LALWLAFDLTRGEHPPTHYSSGCGGDKGAPITRAFCSMMSTTRSHWRDLMALMF